MWGDPVSRSRSPRQHLCWRGEGCSTRMARAHVPGYRAVLWRY